MSSDMDDTSCVLAGAGAAAPSWDSDDMARERSKRVKISNKNDSGGDGTASSSETQTDRVGSGLFFQQVGKFHRMEHSWTNLGPRPWRSEGRRDFERTNI